MKDFLRRYSKHILLVIGAALVVLGGMYTWDNQSATATSETVEEAVPGVRVIEKAQLYLDND